MNNEQELLVNNEALRKGRSVFRALDHSLRQKMLQLIHKNGRIKVTDIYHTLELEQSVASQQLGILREAGIVKTKKDKKFVYYSVNYERLNEIRETTRRLLEATAIRTKHPEAEL